MIVSVIIYLSFVPRDAQNRPLEILFLSLYTIRVLHTTTPAFQDCSFRFVRSW